jgi:hypothetical protein
MRTCLVEVVCAEEDVMTDNRSRRELLERAKGLSRRDVMEELRRNGVNNLNDLVDVRLQEIQKLEVDREVDTEEAWGVLVYRNFILASGW